MPGAHAPPFEPRAAFFLDLDGTLLEIAETPGAVEHENHDISLVEKLHKATGGALALVSGRTLESIDKVVAPLKLPAAGQHGVERRDALGRIHRDPFPVDELQKAARAVEDFAKRHEGLVFENKGYSIALHYRLAPQHREAAWNVVRDAALQLGHVAEVQGGKMVVELKPAGRDKGRAIDEFMLEPPFSGRAPVFIGDDVTDEHGFRVVNGLGGHSVKVGVGTTAARWRLPSAGAVRGWLAAWLKQCGSVST
jgi:trehalose 6-phosphate phosphatase